MVGSKQIILTPTVIALWELLKQHMDESQYSGSCGF